MLYFFKSVNSEKTFYFVNKNEFIVGRKDCDILITGDSSVSRQHAKIQIKIENGKEVVTLEDLGAKYKTFCNDQELTPNIKVHLKINDKIQFGGLSSIFTFHEEKFVVTATQLSSAQKGTLKKQLKLLRGQYVDNWNSDCTHLTLEKVNLTVKVLHVLLDNKPIVLPSFWTKYTESVMNNKLPPDINSYNDPPVAEALLNKTKLDKTVNRSGLFKNKYFLFALEEDKNQVVQVIEKAGGKAISWENNPIQLENILQSSAEFLLMQSSQLSEDKAYNKIMKYFSEKNQRTIPIQEIATAILNGSCEKDCNPEFNRAKEVFLNEENARPMTQGKLLAENTQSQYLTATDIIPDKTISETEDCDMAAPPIKKRKAQCTLEKMFQTCKTKGDSQSSSQNPILHSMRSSSEAQLPKNVSSSEKNVFKKIKLETLAFKEEFQVKEKNSANEQSICREKETLLDNRTEENKDNKGNGSTQANTWLSQSQKRKADAPVENQLIGTIIKMRKVGKSTLINNPFAVQENETIPKIRTKNETLYYTKSSNKNINASWISKQSPMKKEEEEDEAENKDDDDNEKKRFMELFRNKLIIEVMCLPYRSRYCNDEVDFNNTTCAPNFKKFRKVKPLHPQTTIIGKDSFITQGLDMSRIKDTRDI